VVLGALVILWAIVLVPMWLRRHDRTNEVASADRFAGAMRVLSRRTGARTRRASAMSSGRYVMAPPRSSVDHEPLVTVTETESFEVSGPSRYTALAAEGRRRVANAKALTARISSGGGSLDSELGHARREASAPARRPSLAAQRAGERARKLAQRRRLVAAMGGSFFVSALLALVAGGFFVSLQVFVDILVLAGLAHLRAEVVTERARRRSASGPARAARPVADARPVVAPRPAQAAVAKEAAPVRRSAPAATAGRRAGLSGAGTLAAARVMATPAPAAPPAQAPAPAAPAAEARPAHKATAPAVRPQRAATRTVDLTQPGKWTERQAATAAATVTMPAYVTGELVADQRAELEEIERTSEFELDLILGRAVGE